MGGKLARTAALLLAMLAVLILVGGSVGTPELGIMMIAVAVGIVVIWR